MAEDMGTADDARGFCSKSEILFGFLFCVRPYASMLLSEAILALAASADVEGLHYQPRDLPTIFFDDRVVVALRAIFGSTAVWQLCQVYLVLAGFINCKPLHKACHCDICTLQHQPG